MKWKKNGTTHSKSKSGKGLPDQVELPDLIKNIAESMEIPANSVGTANDVPMALNGHPGVTGQPEVGDLKKGLPDQVELLDLITMSLNGEFRSHHP